MSTEKQLQANKENAQRGGVKTPEGKATASMNALKHGLLSSHIVLQNEKQGIFDELLARVEKALKPVGHVEGVLAERIAINIWRMQRFYRAEQAQMDFYREQLANLDFLGSKANSVMGIMTHSETDKLLRYEAAIERGFYRALHELQRLQAARRGESTTLPLTLDIDVSENKYGE
ncbi:hypothetical protein KGQ71_03610 [Patescibacteria group bacterium]|nr:hypothetical protein [Patescibacteria group bacterium]